MRSSNSTLNAHAIYLSNLYVVSGRDATPHTKTLLLATAAVGTGLFIYPASNIYIKNGSTAGKVTNLLCYEMLPNTGPVLMSWKGPKLHLWVYPRKLTKAGGTRSTCSAYLRRTVPTLARDHHTYQENGQSCNQLRCFFYECPPATWGIRGIPPLESTVWCIHISMLKYPPNAPLPALLSSAPIP